MYVFNVANLLVSVLDMAGLLWAPHSVTRHPSNRRGGVQGRVLVYTGWMAACHSPKHTLCLSLGPKYHFSPQSHLEEPNFTTSAENFENQQISRALEWFLKNMPEFFQNIPYTWFFSKYTEMCFSTFRQATNFQDGLLKNFVSLVIPGFMVLEMTWNPGAWMVIDLSGWWFWWLDVGKSRGFFLENRCYDQKISREFFCEKLF